MQVGSVASCLPSKGANSRCLGTYWYVLVHIGMFLVCSWYVLAHIGTILVCFVMYLFVMYL